MNNNSIIFRFQARPSPQLLSVVALVLEQVNWAKDRATVADLRREVCRWMTRVLQRRKQNSNSSSNVVPMGERVEESSRVALDEVALALSLWEEAFSCDDRYSLEQVKVATWVAEVHVESLLLGTVSVTGLEKNTLLSDRTLNAAANLYSLSSLPMDDRLFDAFGAALVSAVRTAQLSNVISLLLLSARRSISNPQLPRYGQLYHRVLYSILSAHYSIARSRLGPKHDSHWILTQELVNYEPPLWNLALKIGLHSEFAYMRGTGHNYVTDFTNLVGQLFKNFNELAQCILAGQVTVDLFKKVVSQQADLVQIWQVTSVLIDISLLRALEQEMSQHNATVTTVIKVMKSITSRLPFLTIYAVYIDDYFMCLI